MKYLVMRASDIYKDDQGNAYPNIFTSPLNNFQYNDVAQKYILTSADIRRFDILINSYYGNANYDDIILWLNKIEHIADVEVGTVIYLPSKKDLTDFIQEYYV